MDNSKEINVRKPKKIDFFGVNIFKRKYTEEWYNWYQSLPIDDDVILITWIPKNKQTNIKPGMIGKIHYPNIRSREDGKFYLQTNIGTLTYIGDFNYKIIK